ncbi:MAG: AbrB/MazE/SpoVT family DNA-binding domain-containing protein [bacterium]
MMTTTLSKKGQIVIPIELRERYNIEPGSRVELMDIGGEIVIIPITIKNPIDEARGILKGGKSTKELLKSIRKEERRLERQKSKA